MTADASLAAAVDAVLFDVDETLYDRRAAQRLVVARMPAALPDLLGGLDAGELEAAWLRSDRETEDHVYSSPDIRASRNVRSALFLRHLGRDETRADEVTDFYLDTYADLPAPVAGAAAVVAACAARGPVGVVSNAFPDAQYRKLDAIGLRAAFACILLSEEFGRRKPDPAIFLHACRQLDVPPARTLYVGDSFANDVVGARGAGLRSCWYNPAAAPVPDGGEPPDVELRRLEQLLPVLGLAAA